MNYRLMLIHFLIDFVFTLGGNVDGLVCSGQNINHEQTGLCGEIFKIPEVLHVLDLLEMTKKSYDGDRGEVERIRNAAVLCLDDIGVQMSKEWVDTVFYSLINERYSNHKITIYTSNVLPDALKIDDRIIDRIASRSYIITLPEVNVRRSKAEAGMKKLLDK